MCTLTYYPAGEDDLWITSNRDEGLLRKEATLPQLRTLENGEKVIMPVDQEAHGTWIAVSLMQRRVQVLLNGAFVAHEHQPPYRRSRGLVLLDALDFGGLEAMAEEYDFTAIEPFTLVAMHQQPRSVEELRWDGKSTHYTTKRPEQPHVWSAAMLYPKEVQRATEDRFASLEQLHISPEDLLQFHAAEHYDTKMERQGLAPHTEVRTLSTSQIQLHPKQLYYRYFDLRHQVQVSLEAPWNA